MPQYSRNEVKAAGKLLRNQGQGLITLEDYQRAITILSWWRACHARPLQTATMGLRSRVASEGCTNASVSQRLKRRRTIIDKLAREPNMQLTTMHDIGGCRAVVGSIEELRRVQKRWKRSTKFRREYDYIERPKVSGYRGVHLIVEYDGYPIEVQLRTLFQHAWATAVEDVGSALGYELKNGQGPEDVLRLFELMGSLLHLLDHSLKDHDGIYNQFKKAVETVPEEVLEMIGLETTSTGDVILTVED